MTTDDTRPPEPSCCDYACYEDPGCACDGCANNADAMKVKITDDSLAEALAALMAEQVLYTYQMNSGPVLRGSIVTQTRALNAAEVADALRAHPDRLAIAASLLTVEDVAEALWVAWPLLRRDGALGLTRPKPDAVAAILAALRDKSCTWPGTPRRSAPPSESRDDHRAVRPHRHPVHCVCECGCGERVVVVCGWCRDGLHGEAS